MEASEIIRELVRAAIDAVRPENFIPDIFSADHGILTIGGKAYPPEKYRHLYVIAVGKAAYGMARAANPFVRPYLTEGLILTKHIPENNSLGKPYRILAGGHPVPTKESIKGAQEILSLLDRADEKDLVIFLISGGGSALMTAPLGGLSLETFQAFSRAVLGCGADIREFNILRKHLDGVKGGRLAQRAAPAQTVTVILSDVVGNPLDIIASGPTVPDPSTYTDALNIFNKYAEKTSFPDEIRKILLQGQRGELPETLKENDTVFGKSDFILAADNRRAAYAAAERGRDLGLHAQVLNTALTGEASQIGRMLPSFFSELQAPGLLIFGGETTVTLKGSGTGGRNQEVALAAVRPMASKTGCFLVTLATDGEDGPTDAAGATVTADTLSHALSLGCDPDSYLKNNDSYRFFKKTGALLCTGPSGTNVNDLTFLLKL